MPSSLIFVGLVVAWLLILVPIVARRRQEVARPSEAALACRVLQRPTVSRRAEEVSEMDEPGPDRPLVDEPEREVAAATEPDPEPDREPEPALDGETEPALESEPAPDSEADSEPPAEPEPEPEPEPADVPGYRSGRGGFDPEAAMLAARARHVVRQRVVLALLLAIVLTAVGALVADSMLWWAHAAADVGLVGYLVYLRRQVRIEEEIRHRRASRMAGSRPGSRPASRRGSGASRDRAGRDRSGRDRSGRDRTGRGRTVGEFVAAQRTGPSRDEREPELPEADLDVEDPALPELEPLEVEDQQPQRPALPPLCPNPLPAAPEGTAVIAVDDEDPGLHELADPGPGGYRRAAGE